MRLESFEPLTIWERRGISDRVCLHIVTIAVVLSAVDRQAFWEDCMRASDSCSPPPPPRRSPGLCCAARSPEPLTNREPGIYSLAAKGLTERVLVCDADVAAPSSGYRLQDLGMHPLMNRPACQLRSSNILPRTMAQRKPPKGCCGLNEGSLVFGTFGRFSRRLLRSSLAPMNRGLH